MAELNKFDLPAFFDREYYESRYLAQWEKGEYRMAKTWEDFYFDNAVAYAFCQVFNANKSVDSKKAMAMAEERKKQLEKEYK